MVNGNQLFQRRMINYFPTKYDLISYLTERHYEQTAEYVLSTLQQKLDGTQDWQKLLNVMVNAVAFYFNNHALTTRLVLGAPFSRADIAIEEKKVNEIAKQLRLALAEISQPLPLPEVPNIAGYAVEIMLAIMRYSYFSAGAISQDAVAEANHALVAYLQRWQQVPCSS